MVESYSRPCPTQIRGDLLVINFSKGRCDGDCTSICCRALTIATAEREFVLVHRLGVRPHTGRCWSI